MESTLITRAGLTFWISAPVEGPKSTSQTSPRLGVGAVDIQVPLAERLERGQGGVVAVLFGGKSGGGGKDRVALVRGQAAQLGSAPVARRVNRRNRHEHTSDLPGTGEGATLLQGALYLLEGWIASRTL